MTIQTAFHLLTFHPDNLFGSIMGWTQQTSKVVGSGPKAQVEIAAFDYYRDGIRSESLSVLDLYTYGEVMSQNLWSKYVRHVVGRT